MGRIAFLLLAVFAEMEHTFTAERLAPSLKPPDARPTGPFNKIEYARLLRFASLLLSADQREPELFVGVSLQHGDNRVGPGIATSFPYGALTAASRRVLRPAIEPGC